MTDFPKRAARMAKVAASAARVGAGVAASRIKQAGAPDPARESALVRAALGNLKGPLMKVGQLLAAIPDLLPPEYAAQLATLQSDAPSMGWPFVRRRMARELGADWAERFTAFDRTASFAASLGQVHRASLPDGTQVACKLQYPDMDSVVEADLSQLRVMLSLFDKIDGTVDSRQAYQEIADRLREELDYKREARSMQLYARMLQEVEGVRVPTPITALSTDRLLTMTWLQGERLIDAAQSMDQERRNALGQTMFRLWYTPFYRYGVIHGDPHMGNYTLAPDGTINLLDFGCIRVFRPEMVQAVLLLFKALREENAEKACEAYTLWGFDSLTKPLIETLNQWARFIYAPVLHDGVYDLSSTNSTAAGRKLAAAIRAELKTIGAVRLPPEFVLMDRASIGLGGLFLRLGAQVNWHQLFRSLTYDFDLEKLRERQKGIDLSSEKG